MSKLESFKMVADSTIRAFGISEEPVIYLGSAHAWSKGVIQGMAMLNADLESFKLEKKALITLELVMQAHKEASHANKS